MGIKVACNPTRTLYSSSMILCFHKMHGLGNDFVVLDGVREQVSLTPDTVRRIGDRRFGVGFDQLLLIRKSEAPDTDFACRIYNTDGSEAEQCGNGVRCVGRFLVEQGLTEKSEISLGTRGGPVQLFVEALDRVRVDMGEPVLAQKDVPFLGEGQGPHQWLRVDGIRVDLTAVSMGNPHAVTAVEDVATAPLEKLGPGIGRHETFPDGANVGFMEIVDRTRIRLRVFERGVGETLACGSGACAAVVAGRLRGELEPRVLVELPGGALEVEWGGQGHPVFMTGPATQVFEGRLEL